MRPNADAICAISGIDPGFAITIECPGMVAVGPVNEPASLHAQEELGTPGVVESTTH
jgi:hypothetical protein